MNEDFFEQPYVREVMNPLLNGAKDTEKMSDAIKEELEELIVPAAHSEHVTQLPKGAKCLGSSAKTKNEIWTLDDRVLCMQFHPEFNSYFIEELIINKMYDVGQLDDTQMTESLERTKDPQLPLTRNIINRIAFNFLHMNLD